MHEKNVLTVDTIYTDIQLMAVWIVVMVKSLVQKDASVVIENEVCSVEGCEWDVALGGVCRHHMVSDKPSPKRCAGYNGHVTGTSRPGEKCNNMIKRTESRCRLHPEG